jgi:hypothetical protein
MAVAKNNRHNAAFVVGSVLGAVAGAAAALWKTPYTGNELRAKLTGAKARSQEPGMVVASPETGATMSTRQGERSMKDKVLSGVEKTLAPLVGVELGKTANGSGPGTGSDIKVNADLASSTGNISNRKAWQGDTSSAGTSTSTSADGTPIIGLSRDKVDADKWSSAYSGETTVPSTTTSDTSAVGATAATTSAASSDMTIASGEGSWARNTRAWMGDSSAAGPSPADETPTLGLSLDKVDADKWAAAYSGEDTSTSSGSSSTPPRSSGRDNPQGEPANAAAESAAKTAQGAKPAFPGDEPAGHAPADRTAPDSSVADVSRQGQDEPAIQHSTADAATIDQLTTPQTDRVPDSLRQPTERSTHPFPKLGGKE